MVVYLFEEGAAQPVHKTFRGWRSAPQAFKQGFSGPLVGPVVPSLKSFLLDPGRPALPYKEEWPGRRLVSVFVSVLLHSTARRRSHNTPHHMGSIWVFASSISGLSRSRSPVFYPSPMGHAVSLSSPHQAPPHADFPCTHSHLRSNNQSNLFTKTLRSPRPPPLVPIATPSHPSSLHLKRSSREEESPPPATGTPTPTIPPAGPSGS